MHPGEHKTVQSRVLEYAQAIGWTFVSREEAEQRRGIAAIRNRKLGIKNYQNSSLFFDDLLDAKVWEFNPRDIGAVEALPDSLRCLHTDILTTGKGLSLFGSVLK